MTEKKPLPAVLIPGIGQSRVDLLDKNGNRVKSAWPLDFDKTAIEELKGPAIRMMLFRRDAGFSDKVAELVRRMLDPIACGSDGAPLRRLSTVRYPDSLAESGEEARRHIRRMIPCDPLAAEIGEENIYFFSFNSFGDPYEIAAELDAYIQNVKAERGVSQVNLLPVSMGGAIATAYFDAYGEKNDVSRTIYFVAALDGSVVAADLFEKKISRENGGSLLEIFLPKNDVRKLSELMKLLPPGESDLISDKMLTAALETVLVNSPAIWSLIPADRYDALSERYLSAPSRQALREKTDRYHAAQAGLREIFAARQAAGTRFFACVGYGLPPLGISPSQTVSSDGVVPVISSAPGVTAAPLGETLPETGGALLSPDGEIDVSAALLRDSTWFFHLQDHEGIAQNQTALRIAARALSDENFTGVESDPALPRFGTAAGAPAD